MLPHHWLQTNASQLNPFSAFCLYVAARVFVQYLKSRPEGQAVKSSLQFLLTALGALKQFSALTESFLIQLDVDLSGTTFGSSMRSMRSKEAVSDFFVVSPSLYDDRLLSLSERVFKIITEVLVCVDNQKL